MKSVRKPRQVKDKTYIDIARGRGYNPVTGGGVGRVDLVPVNANEFWLTAPSSTGRVIAHRFARNNFGDSSTPPASIGAPFQPWRYCGSEELDAFGSSVAAPRSAWSIADGGAQDYAFQRQSDSIFGGSYHGGEALVSSSIKGNGVEIDPTVPASYSSFSLTQTSTITWSGGAIASIASLITIGRNGRLSFDVQASSAIVMTLAYIGMVVGSGAFAEAIDAGLTVALPVGDIYFGTKRSLILRNPSSGHRIAINMSAADPTTYESTRVQRTNSPARSKFYPMLAFGKALGAQSMHWSIDFSRDENYDPTCNLVGNPDFATLDGWLATTGGANISLVGGKLRMTRSASAETREIFPIICEVGATYDFTVECAQSVSDAGARTAITGNANGSVASPAPAAANEAYASSIWPRRFVATQVQHWVWLNQAVGTAGQTVDWDNVSVKRVV